eukprot:gnl/TRDRNA2_/TRDRNA2_180991_c0_seq1.p1 gnl/TRDRNA2_/TRDRNA2_180991_c0~~gnl/TRDRNA2_/TRDRNA2_180991_c0_seq1.p1  ORF type:complete len:443 (+),score=83.03 gnl/TRDRNA2_/TRDRNA2_180991_c0_seq1:103-1431(+)
MPSAEVSMPKQRTEAETEKYLWQSPPVEENEEEPFRSKNEMLVATHMLWVALFGVLFIVTSAGLIAFNKHLMHEDRFPYAVPLVLLHAAFCSVFAALLLLIRPSLFPSLTDPEKKVSIDRDLMLKGPLPIALLFSVQLVLSNTAYLHSSVAFLQMMKEANIVLVYIFSLIALLEKFSWPSVMLLAGMLGATAMTIHGEMNFSMTGFVMQGIGQVAECAKIVLQALLLTNAGRKMDVLTFVLLVMPVCFCILLVVLLWIVFLYPNDHFRFPQWSEVEIWWPILLLNACLAFTLNVVTALFVKHSSAVAFILCGIFKDVMILIAGRIFYHEMISVLQYIGFTLQLLFILIWSLMKSFPHEFENGIIAGCATVLFGYEQRSRNDQESCAAEAVLNYGTMEKDEKGDASGESTATGSGEQSDSEKSFQTVGEQTCARQEKSVCQQV